MFLSPTFFFDLQFGRFTIFVFHVNHTALKMIFESNTVTIESIQMHHDTLEGN